MQDKYENGIPSPEKKDGHNDRLESGSSLQGQGEATAPLTPPSPPSPASTGSVAETLGPAAASVARIAVRETVRSAAVKGGKGGEGGGDGSSDTTGSSATTAGSTIAEFVAAVFRQVPEGAFPAVCSKPGDPSDGGWQANRSDQVAHKLTAANNNYLNCSSFYPGHDGSFRARKDRFAACHTIVLDDVGTKVPLDRLSDFVFSWLIETSPGNFQAGIILADPITDGHLAVRLLSAVIAAGLCDAGAGGPQSRWARLPVGINGKPKYADETGAPFRCRLIQWCPDKRYSGTLHSAAQAMSGSRNTF